MYDVLVPGSSSVATGAKRSPFIDHLSIDGARVTINMAGTDYTGTPANVFWIAPKDAIVCGLAIGVGDISLAQASNFAQRITPDGGTAQIDLAVYDASNNIVQDLTTGFPVLSALALSTVSSGNSFLLSTPSSTVGNNEYMMVHYIDFVATCGGGISVPVGYKFGFVIGSNWSSATQLILAISGFFR